MTPLKREREIQRKGKWVGETNGKKTLAKMTLDFILYFLWEDSTFTCPVILPRVFIHADQPILTVSKQIFGCKSPPLFVSVSEMRFIFSTVLNYDKHVI